MAAFNLLDQLVFYGSYHHNKWNKLIHVFFVPLIWWTAVVWGCYTGPLVPGSGAIQDVLKANGLGAVGAHVETNLGFLAWAFYASYYVTLEPVAGTLMGCIMFGMYIGAHAFATSVGWALAWKYALALHVLSWYMQIHPGHGILEGRKPALLDSMFQSFVLAPLFVWLEVLFVFGYRPKLAAEMESRVVEAIRQYKADKQAKDQAKAN